MSIGIGGYYGEMANANTGYTNANYTNLGYTNANYGSIGYDNDINPNGKTGIGDDDTQNGEKVCQTCKNRKYVDGSDEANVSFKSAAHISPEAAGGAVRAHEGQHVANAYNKAATGNGKVVSASVSIHMDICPECGRSYVSGGVTRTQIKYYNEENPYQQDLKQTAGINLRGANVDSPI